jgi:tetratricopeptide (TPR) repeat protein
MKPGLMLSVAAIMAGLFAFDRFLAAVEARELASQAAGLAAEGDRLIAAGRPAEAIAPLRRAHALARTNMDYQLSLARALLRSGDTSEAETNLRDLLNRHSNDGATNLAMARLQAHEGNAAEAAAFYHRATYGAWPKGVDLRSVRLELAEYLAAHGSSKELLSELLLLQEEEDTALIVRIAQLFLVAKSPARAAEEWRKLIRLDPGNIAAYEGLGNAELAEGHFHAAQSSFLEALRRRPGDEGAIRRLRFTSLLTSLDPTPRRLSSRQKFERSTRILELARTGIAACVGKAGAGTLIAEAGAMLSEKVKGPVTNELSESRLALAESLWKQRVERCGSAASEDDPLPILMHTLNQ